MFTSSTQRTSCPQAHQRRLGLAGRLTLAVGVSIALLGGLTPLATAANVTARGPGILVSWSNYQGLWLGAYLTDEGSAFCVDPWGTDPRNHTQGRTTELTAWSNRQGTAVTAAQLAQAAYLTWKYANTTPKTNELAVATKLALYTVLGLTNQPMPNAGGWRANFDVTVSGSDGREIATRYGVLQTTLNLVSEARSKATTWDGTTFTKTQNITETRFPGDVLKYSVTFPGIPAGYTVTFTVTKPDGTTETLTSQTDASGTASLTYTTPADPQGEYSVRWDIANIPPRYPMAFTGGGSPSQDLFLGVPTPRGLNSAYSAITLRDGRVTVPETVISNQSALPGETITDLVRAGGLVDLVYGDPVVWVFTTTLYKADPDQNGACDAVNWTTSQIVNTTTFTVDNSTIDANGRVEATMGTYTIPRFETAHCYSYGEVLRGTVSNGDVMTGEHPVGDIMETTLVRSNVPTLGTQINNQLAEPGKEISDTVTITNLSFDPIGNDAVTWTLHGTLVKAAPVNKACTNVDWTKATLVMDFDTPLTPGLFTNGAATISGLGKYKTPVGQAAQCYSYGEQLIATWASTTTPYTVDHPVGDVAQTTLVRGGIDTGTGGSIVSGGDYGNRLGAALLVVGILIGLVGISIPLRRRQGA